MKRSITTLLVFLFASSLLAAQATQRYVVATRRVMPLQHVRDLVRHNSESGDIDASRDLRAFVNIPAFAADLTADEAAALRQEADVRYVEPVAERHALEIGGGKTAMDVPRDLSGQVVPMGVDAVHARDVWPVTRGQGVNVAIIDTGIDYTHPELSPAYAGGYNAITKTNDPKDDNGHGSHVAGTIAAADNNIGVVGIAPQVRIWAVKMLKSDGSGTTDTEIAALDWIISKKHEIGGNWVVNLSLGSTEFNQAESDAFARAIGEGLVICAAAGNESSSGVPAPIDYPGAYPGVLAIGAVDSNRVIADFSNQGPQLALVGPGIDVLSTVIMGTGSIAGVQGSVGSFTGAQVEGGKQGSVTGQYVSCGLGNQGDFPASVAGNIALIKRGSLTFNQKVRNAVAAGASAVIIYNSDNTALNFTLLSSSDPSAATFNWPVTVALTLTDGQKLVDAGSGTVTVVSKPDDYAVYSGTSMATPHATGVAALVWGTSPSSDANTIRQAIENTADDLGASGFDQIYGFGELNALNAAKMLDPSGFGAPVTPPNPSQHPGRHTLIRGH